MAIRTRLRTEHYRAGRGLEHKRVEHKRVEHLQLGITWDVTGILGATLSGVMSRNRPGALIREAIRNRPGARIQEAMKAERSAALVAAWLDTIRYAPDGEQTTDCQVAGCTGTGDVCIWPTATAHWPDDSGPEGVVDREGAACIYHAWLILNWMPRVEVTRVEVYVERDELAECNASELSKLEWIVRQWPDAISGLLPAD